MSKTKFAICSDLHLGVHQNSEKWLNEALKFAEWFKEELFRNGIYDIIIPGDFFHDRTDINLLTIQYAAKILETWRDFHIWMIPGNHDCFYKDNATVSSVSIFQGHKNVTLFDKVETLIREGKQITFVPWSASVDEIPTCDVIIGHFELNGFKMNSFKMCENGVTCDHMLDKAGLVLTGHFHMRQERKSKRGTILYVGTPYEMDYNDMGVDKGYHILDISDLTLEFVKYNNTTKHKKIKVTDLIANKDDITNYLNSEVRGNVVTLVIDKEIGFDLVNTLVQKVQLLVI